MYQVGSIDCLFRSEKNHLFKLLLKKKSFSLSLDQPGDLAEIRARLGAPSHKLPVATWSPSHDHDSLRQNSLPVSCSSWTCFSKSSLCSTLINPQPPSLTWMRTVRQCKLKLTKVLWKQRFDSWQDTGTGTISRHCSQEAKKVLANKYSATVSTWSYGIR